MIFSIAWLPYVRYYGYYTNVSRSKRQKENQGGLIPYIQETVGSSKEYRKNWARLIKKIYEADPLICPKCQGPGLKGLCPSSVEISINFVSDVYAKV
jgi:hypothetical protein